MFRRKGHRCFTWKSSPSSDFLDRLEATGLDRFHTRVENGLGLEIEEWIEGWVRRLSGLEVMDEFLGEISPAGRQRIGSDQTRLGALADDQADEAFFDTH